jgi:hypothetical protein
LHVIYQGIDRHLHALVFGGRWSHRDLTAASRSPEAFGDPACYTWDADQTHHVVYRGTDYHLHELVFKGRGWDHNDLTAATGVPATFLDFGDPACYAWDADQTRHVVYRGDDAHLHQLVFREGRWSHHDLTAASEGPQASNNPVSYTSDVDQTQRVVYTSPDGHLHELVFNGRGWNDNDLTAASGGLGGGGRPACYAWDVNRTLHVVYNDGGIIRELRFQ